MVVAHLQRIGASTISRLPVPLNSSKITSSILLPVSISAVARIVSEPPSSTLRAEPKNRFGLLQRVGVQAAGEDLARLRALGVPGPSQARDRIEEDHDVRAVLDHPLGLFDHHLARPGRAARTARRTSN